MTNPTHRRWSLLRWTDPTEPAHWTDPERRIVLVHGMADVGEPTRTIAIEAVTAAERAGAAVVYALSPDDLRGLAPHGPHRVPGPRYIIGLGVERQAELDEHRGLLLDVEARFRAIVVTPRESIRLGLHAGSEERTFSPSQGWTTRGPGLGVDLVVAVGSRWPTHPAWIRALKDEAAAAGVPFAFLGWGDWLPMSEAPPRHANRRTAWVWRVRENDPEDLPITCYTDPGGRCRTLDDEEHLGLPAALDDVEGALS